LKRLLVACWMMLAACPCFAQLPGLGSTWSGSIGGTLSFVQSGSCSFSSVYSCSVTMSTGALTSGNLYVVFADSGEAFEGIRVGSVASSQTYTSGTTLTEAIGCSNGLNTTTWIPTCDYVLPTGANGGTSPLTVYFQAPTPYASTTGTFQLGETATQATSGATGIVYALPPLPNAIGNSLGLYHITGSPDATHTWTGGISGATIVPSSAPETSTGHAFIMEWHPSANGSQVALDNDSAIWNQTASTSASGPILTTSGTSPVQLSAIFGSTSNLTISGVNSPYSTTNQNYHGGNQEGFAGAQTTTTPLWTITSNTSLARGMVFSYNPTAFVEDMYIGFDSCTNNSALTALCLGASAQGFNGGLWVDNGPQTGTMIAATAASHPPLFGLARLGDGSSVTAGSGTLGAEFPGNGSAQERWAFNLNQNNFASLGTTSLGPVSIGFWWQWAAACTDSGNFISLKSTSPGGYVDANVAGTCNIQITTQGGTSTTSSWAFLVNTWYWVDVLYSNIASGTSTVKLYNATAITGSSCSSGTETLTTAGLPADGNIITGSSIYVRNQNQTSWQGPYTVTVSGNNVSYSQTCPDPGYGSNSYIGAQVGTTLVGTPTTSNFNAINFGDYSGTTLTTGKYVYFDSMDLSLTGRDPLLP
jgi:hypothetical protein